MRLRTFSIRAAMLTLVIGGIVVMVATATVAGWLSYREQRDRIGSSLIAASRALVFAVDNELEEPLAFVNGLSSSTSFTSGDFRLFEARMREKLAPYGYVAFIKSADGQERVDEAKSPVAGGPFHLGKASRSYLGRIEADWMALIDVPVETKPIKGFTRLPLEYPTAFSRLRWPRRFPAFMDLGDSRRGLDDSCAGHQA
jgi:hypothetical protein